MKIAIIDDEPSMRDQLENYILQFAASQQLDLKSVQFPSADAFLLTGGHSFDIIIFDIDMPGTSGLNAARKIRETDENTVILFVTNIAQYAINGYEVDAVDYIIKPVGYYDFIMKFRKAVRRAERIYGSQIVIDTVKGPVGLSTDSILYVEVMAHYVIYHTFQQAYRVRGSMKEHETALRTYHFARCHKSYLINLKHLKGISSSDVSVADLSIPLGRSYKDTLLSEYMNYLHR